MHNLCQSGIANPSCWQSCPRWQVQGVSASGATAGFAEVRFVVSASVSGLHLEVTSLGYQ